MKAFAAGPLLAALILALSLWAQPQGAVTRGPEAASEPQNNQEMQDMIRLIASAKHEGDDTFLTLLEVGNLLMTGIGFLTVVFKGGKYVEKVDRHDIDIGKVREEMSRLQRDIFSVTETKED